ncbi:MAG TPA: extensin family protein [Hyphomicrobium sp.]|nr:extensin family protein [Hyphomicrobium sp.]HRO49406.1 extensin family protein [Hyphomicrobium sp.]
MRFSRVLVLPVLVPALLSACSSGPNFVAQYEPWRDQEESACIASGVLQRTTYLTSRSALGGPGVCGTERPYEVTAVDDGRVRIKPAALLRCPMIPQIERWIREHVSPAAVYHFGAEVEEITTAGSYNCRPINHKSGGKLSEHGYANALDVSGFVLSNGQRISLIRHWNGNHAERAFLRAAQRGACQHFTTVLGPEYNRAHRDHFHVDLARRGRDGLGRVCK